MAGPFFTSSLEYGRDPADRRMGVIFTVHDDDGTDGAAAETGDCFKAEHVVRGRFSGLNTELFFELRQNPRPASHVTGRPRADCDNVPASRLEAEGPIERGDTDDVDERKSKFPGNGLQRFPGKIIAFGLDILEDGDECVFRPFSFFDQALDFGRVNFQGCPPGLGR